MDGLECLFLLLHLEVVGLSYCTRQASTVHLVSRKRLPNAPPEQLSSPLFQPDFSYVVAKKTLLLPSSFRPLHLDDWHWYWHLKSGITALTFPRLVLYQHLTLPTNFPCLLVGITSTLLRRATHPAAPSSSPTTSILAGVLSARFPSLLNIVRRFQTLIIPFDQPLLALDAEPTAISLHSPSDRQS